MREEDVLENISKVEEITAVCVRWLRVEMKLMPDIIIGADCSGRGRMLRSNCGREVMMVLR